MPESEGSMEPIPTVAEGQRISLLNGPIASSQSELTDYTVGPACEEKQRGHWACVTHPRGCPAMVGMGRTFDQEVAVREKCLGVWVCWEHGPEQP
jgi:hypothetical protein